MSIFLSDRTDFVLHNYKAGPNVSSYKEALCGSQLSDIYVHKKMHCNPLTLWILLKKSINKVQSAFKSILHNSTSFDLNKNLSRLHPDPQLLWHITMTHWPNSASMVIVKVFCNKSRQSKESSTGNLNKAEIFSLYMFLFIISIFFLNMKKEQHLTEICKQLKKPHKAHHNHVYKMNQHLMTLHN